jgi:GH24 family phage-related lysozyme (muramidase)
LRDESLESIAEGFMRYVNPGSPFEKGLRRRRSAEVALFLR